MQTLPEENESVDLLISQYAGFISQYCTPYLRVGGLLLVNNSHGDASMASIDPRYELTGVVNRRQGKHRINVKNLDTYLIPKSAQPITKTYLEKIQRGVAYTKSPSMYIFKRIV